MIKKKYPKPSLVVMHPEMLKELAKEIEKALNKIMCESKGRISHKVR
jgi:hypothetical protein